MNKKIIILLATLILVISSNISAFAGTNLVKGVNSYSNATIEQLQKITKGTPMYGCEQVILDTEKQNDLNAIFICAVAETETSMGLAGVGRSHLNNLFGTRNKYGWIYYSNPSESIKAFGSMINRIYFGNGLYSLSAIGNKYCGGDWANKVERNINKLYNQMLA